MTTKFKASYAELNSISPILITGKDCKKFLQGQLTCDINKLNGSNSIYGCYSNIKGRVISTFYVGSKHENNIQLILPNQSSEQTIKLLNKYAIFSKVSISKSTDKVISIFGADSINLIEYLLNLSINWKKNTYIVTDNVTITKTNTIEPSFFINGDSDEILKVSKLLSSHIDKIDINNFQKFFINEKICNISNSMSELYLPQELNLIKNEAVSLDKGCYMGQEIIARLYYLGKFKKQIKKAEIHLNEKVDSFENMKLINDENKTMGNILTIAKCFENEYIGLILISKNHKPPITITRDGINIGAVLSII